MATTQVERPSRLTEESQWLAQRVEDDPFLRPIDNPKGIMMKIVFYFTRRQFGKVLGPLRVFAARMPTAFCSYYGKGYKLDHKLQLPRELVALIRDQVARTNVCLFCMDTNRWAVVKESLNEPKFEALERYSTSPLFSEAERAALDYVTQLTKEKKVDPAKFGLLTRYYSDRAICEIVWLVASEHMSNITNIGLNIHSDMLCNIIKR